MKKRFMVIGAGRFGSAVIKELHRKKAEVVGVDLNKNLLEECSDYTSYSVVGNAKDSDVLTELEIESFDAVVVAIGEAFDSSILITKKLHDIGAKKIIAKATTKEMGEILRAVGATEVVFPEREGGFKTANLLCNASILEYFELNQYVSAIETVVPKSFVGKTVVELNLPKKHGLTIAALLRNGKPILDHLASVVVEKGDVILLVGENNAITMFKEKMLD